MQAGQRGMKKTKLDQNSNDIACCWGFRKRSEEKIKRIDTRCEVEKIIIVSRDKYNELDESID